MSWAFNPMKRGDLNIDPVEREFFATETLSGITDALVREAIQNSLDAAMEGKVRVRFLLGQASATVREDFIDELWPHAKAAFEAEAPLPSLDGPLPFLAVEDAGTRGLEGDPQHYEDSQVAGNRNDFYYFWRNVGRSRKGESDRGRWGLGKTVFAAASRLHAFFGVTRRHNEKRALLMGQAVLRIHQIGSRRYQPYGYYGVHEKGFTLPVDSSDVCQGFIESFGLRRQGAGLSIVIPYPDESITAEKLFRSVVHHYFHPLLREKLEVEIEDVEKSLLCLRGSDLEKHLLSRDVFRDLLPSIKLARWGLQVDRSELTRLSEPDVGRAPKLEASLFDVHDLGRLRMRYDEGRRIAIDVPLWIAQKKDRCRSSASFRLLMERDSENGRGVGLFVRNGITVENPGMRRPRGVRWALVVEDPVLSAFLGDAENPAHTEWQRSSPKFKEKYILGPSTLDFVRSAPAKVASILSHVVDRRDPNLLQDVFSVSFDGAVVSRRQGPVEGGGAARTDEVSVPGVLGGGGALVLGMVKTGFRLRGRLGEKNPRRIEIRAAYDVLRGDPFRRYSPLDFRMNKSIAVQVRGAKVLAREENRIELMVEGLEFEILVTRFDESRDLRVKVVPLEDG